MATNAAEQLAPEAPPSPYRAAIKAANAIRLPEHVRQAYEWNGLKDVFLERRPGGNDHGHSFCRMWFAATDAARRELPPNPEQFSRIPDQFRHPLTRQRLSEQQHAAQRRSWEEERAGQEARRPVLVP